MTKKSDTPAIRFKGFTDTWEQRKLGDVVKEITRNDPESEAPIMMITANNGFIEQSERYAFNNAGESLKKYILLKKGELAYNHGASKLRPYGSCFALTTAENARIPFVYHCFSAENQNAEFMSIELNGAEIENQLRKIVSSGARMDGLLNISFDEYTSVSVLLPGTEEQDCIADFFRQLDNLITLHQRKYDKLTNVKKSMLEKMFPKNGSNVPEIRFKGFTEAWEQRKLGEVLTSLQNNTLSRADLSSEQGIAKNVHYGDILVKFGEVIDVKTESLPLIADEAVIAKYRSSFLQNGDVIVADTAEDETVGKCTEIAGLGDEIVISGLHTIPYRPVRKFASGYLGYYMNSVSFHNQLLPLMQGIKVTSISKTMLQNTDIIYPKSATEQEAVGKYFCQLDNLITLHQRELEKLKNIKKSCLENMFV